jgi:hypothetical protein
MRDLSRFLNLYNNFIIQDKVDPPRSLLHAFRICYLQRLSAQKQEEALRIYFTAESTLLNSHYISSLNLSDLSHA